MSPSSVINLDSLALLPPAPPKRVAWQDCLLDYEGKLGTEQPSATSFLALLGRDLDTGLTTSKLAL